MTRRELHRIAVLFASNPGLPTRGLWAEAEKRLRVEAAREADRG